MKKEYIRSPFFYVGDKYKIIKQVEPLFPKKINRFIEPFTGGGTVFMNVEAKEFLVNDLNKEIVTIHRMLKKYKNKPDDFFDRVYSTALKYDLSRSFKEDIIPKTLRRQYIKTYYSKYNKEGYNKLKSDYNESDRDPFLLYILMIYGFNRMIRFNKSGLFNLPPGNVDFNKNVVRALEHYFDVFNNKSIKIYNKDYGEFLKKINFQEGDFLYLDPPYLISNCEYNKMWDRTNENELLELLIQLDKQGVKFALSNVVSHKGFENNILKEWISNNGFNVHPIESKYISYHDNNHNGTIEVVVTNYV